VEGNRRSVIGTWHLPGATDTRYENGPSSSLFEDVTKRRLVVSYRRFGTTRVWKPEFTSAVFPIIPVTS
jgi:hypothetical protein